MRAAMYLRQSKDRYGNEVRVDDQREDLTKLCTARGWSWTEYKDNDFGASGRMPGSTKASKKRPAYDNMVRDIKAGKLDAIAVWDTDRLYRQPRELEDIIDLADLHGVALATVTGDYDLSTPSGRANARIRGCSHARKWSRRPCAKRTPTASGWPTNEYRGGPADHLATPPKSTRTPGCGGPSSG